jgi:hypothetical protein
MKIDEETIRKRYENEETDDLIAIYKSGTPSDEAYEILESVLRDRKVAIPERPNNIVVSPKQPLSKWIRILISVAILLGLSILFEILVKPFTGKGVIPWGLSVVLPWFFFNTLLFPRKPKK